MSDNLNNRQFNLNDSDDDVDVLDKSNLKKKGSD